MSRRVSATCAEHKKCDMVVLLRFSQQAVTSVGESPKLTPQAWRLAAKCLAASSGFQFTQNLPFRQPFQDVSDMTLIQSLWKRISAGWRKHRTEIQPRAGTARVFKVG